MRSVRRLAAILAADVAGYSRLMGADEEGTHERLRAHFAELVNPQIAEHRGRVVKNTGDGLLAEFSSVVDAVRCAVELQRGMAERNASVPADKRIEFRIGINLGDVIAEETTSMATASTSPPGSKRWRSQAVSVSPAPSTTTSGDRLSLRSSRIRANKASRTSPGQYGFTRSTFGPSPMRPSLALQWWFGDGDGGSPIPRLLWPQQWPWS